MSRIIFLKPPEAMILKIVGAPLFELLIIKQKGGRVKKKNVKGEVLNK
jgi:hypothetical protein